MAQLDQAKVFIQIEEKQKRNPRKIQNMEREAKSPMSIYANVIVAVIVIVTKSSNQMSSNQTHLTSHNQKKTRLQKCPSATSQKKKKSHLHHCLSLSKRKKESKENIIFHRKLCGLFGVFILFFLCLGQSFHRENRNPKNLPLSSFIFFLCLLPLSLFLISSSSFHFYHQAFSFFLSFTPISLFVL